MGKAFSSAALPQLITQLEVAETRLRVLGVILVWLKPQLPSLSKPVCGAAELCLCSSYCCGMGIDFSAAKCPNQDLLLAHKGERMRQLKPRISRKKGTPAQWGGYGGWWSTQEVEIFFHFFSRETQFPVTHLRVFIVQIVSLTNRDSGSFQTFHCCSISTNPPNFWPMAQ